MKNILFILILVSFCASGQRMGLKAGLNIGKERVSDSGITITSESTYFFMGGFFISEKLSNDISLGGEIIYSLDGGKYNLSSFGSFGTYTDRFHYLSIPVLLKYHASKYFNVNAGPQIGFLLKAEEDDGRSKTDFTDDVKPMNFSAAFGAELNLKAMDIGFRYVLGLSNINDIEDTTFEVNLSTIQIYLGQTF
ncbi:porin family protein [Ekhidna sp. MALMAid0563]|uniref:porin family protein n=1 Tax=Ekhidna sp. MALMAid0563 TaxID=3143937 RepID=UPI0032DEA102